MKQIILTIILATAVMDMKAAEGAKFFQLSLTPNIAIQSRDTRIDGITLAIWGENPQSAFAWGFVNGSTGDSKGFSMGLCNYAENYKGVEWGFVNYSTATFVGGQIGLVNVGKDVHGIQWGTVNYCDTMKGVQIGLINIINQNPWFEEFPDKLAKGFVIVNWSF